MTEESDELESSIAFVLLCLFGGVDVEEVRRWAEHRIATMPISPAWLVDLSEFRESPKDIYRTVGHVPDREFTDDEEAAVAGIALERNRHVQDLPCAPVDARSALEALPVVRAEFARTFPFLSDW